MILAEENVHDDSNEVNNDQVPGLIRSCSGLLNVLACTLPGQVDGHLQEEGGGGDQLRYLI